MITRIHTKRIIVIPYNKYSLLVTNLPFINHQDGKLRHLWFIFTSVVHVFLDFFFYSLYTLNTLRILFSYHSDWTLAVSFYFASLYNLSTPYFPYSLVPDQLSQMSIFSVSYSEPCNNIPTTYKLQFGTLLYHIPDTLQPICDSHMNFAVFIISWTKCVSFWNLTHALRLIWKHFTYSRAPLGQSSFFPLHYLLPLYWNIPINQQKFKNTHNFVDPISPLNKESNSKGLAVLTVTLCLFF